MRGVRESDPKELPDFFLRGHPMTIETAQAYFRVKHYAEWLSEVENKREIVLHPWDTWDNLADRLGQRFELHIWHPDHWKDHDGGPMTMAHRTDLLGLCDALQKVGIWISLSDEGKLIVGPASLVKQHADLLEGVRTFKTDILHLLEDCLAHSVFGTQADDPRFDREECPDCHQQCLIVLSPRRLGVHRLPGGKEVCPGSDRAQQGTAQVIMQAFIDDRCLRRPTSVVTWYALRGALEAWCLERAFLLPPRPFIVMWLDTHFSRHGSVDNDESPMWAGLTLTLPEWGLDDEPRTAPAMVRPPRRKKAVLKA